MIGTVAHFGWFFLTLKVIYCLSRVRYNTNPSILNAYTSFKSSSSMISVSLQAIIAFFDPFDPLIEGLSGNPHCSG